MNDATATATETETETEPETATATATATPTAQAQDWLNRFDQALQQRDLDAAVALFGDDCYWRDLVSFTWNICTQENPAQVRAMLAARLDDVAPSNWQV